MSVQAMGWVLDHSPTEGTERLVLLSLANHAGASPVDGAWESYPGVATIQKEANLRRERTVQEVLSRLVAGGHLERVVNGAPDDRIRKDRRPNLYRILVERGVGFAAAPVDPLEEPDSPSRGAATRHPERGAAERHPAENGVPSDDNTGCRVTTQRGAVSRRNGVPSDGTQTVNEPSVEPSEEPKDFVTVPATTRSLALVVDAAEPLPTEPGAAFELTTWDRFWNRWPRKTHKTEAKKAWTALIGRGVSDLEILASLERWLAYWDLAGTDEQYIPYPANWLKRGDWQENPPAPPKPKGKQKTEGLQSFLGDFIAKEGA